MKEARTVLGRVKTDFPGLDIDLDLLLAQAQIQQVDVGILNFQMQFGPITTFPAVFGMASLFAAYNQLPVHPQFAEYVNNFDVANRCLPPDTFYFMHDPSWFSIDAEVGHCLIMCCDSSRKQALFFAQIFNQPGIAVLLPYTGNDASYSYGVDVLNGCPATIKVEESKLRSLEWSATHTNGDPKLWKAVEERSNPLLALARKIGFANEVRKVFEKHSGGNLEGTPTAAQILALSQDLARLVMWTMYPDGMPKD